MTTTTPETCQHCLISARDWAEDHTHLESLCRKAGIEEAKVVGDSHGVPGIQRLADLLAERLARVTGERDEAVRVLEPLVNVEFATSIKDDQRIYANTTIGDLRQAARVVAKHRKEAKQ